MAILSHAGAFLGGVVLPAVLYATAGEKRFLAHHARESLNFQLTFLAAYLGSLVLLVAGFVFAGAGSGGAFLGIGVLAWCVFALIAVLLIGHWVLAVMGMLAASRLEWWRYPVSIRFFKGGGPPAP